MDYIILGLLVLLQIEIAVGVWLWRMKIRPTKNPVFIDTSVLMDGRIVAIIAAGFAPDTLYIPSSVLRELQLVADGSDSDKRARARHGLDIASELTQTGRVKVVQDNATTGVDDELLVLARRHKGRICTIDFNLNKVAKAQGIDVLNVHELAQQLRAMYLPGEKVSLMVTQKGSDPRQGVGYLADGTMVVIDNAGSDIGKTVTIEIVRSIQTTAGRMLFAKKQAKAPIEKSQQRNVPEKTKAKGRKKMTRQTAEDSLISLVESAKD